MTEVSINLNTLAAKQQSIVGIPKGDCEQLRGLMEAVAERKVCALNEQDFICLMTYVI